MTAAAVRRASRARCTTLRLCVASLFLLSAAPGAAQVGGAVSLFSEARFRGYSLSAGHPVAVLDLSYDHPSGLYGSLSGSLVLGSEETVQPLELQMIGGYARQLSSGLTVDLGVVRSDYSRYSRRGSPSSYTEIYAGLARKFLSARITYSPHYFEAGARKLYGELNANVSPVSKLHLNGHAGLLIPVADPPNRSSRSQYDWRVGVSREVGRAAFHVDWTSGGPDRDRYRGRYHSRNALVFGVSYAL